MAKISWDDVGSREYSAGVDRGVFYPPVGSGIPWNGLSSVDESSNGSNNDALYIDGVKHRHGISNSEFTPTINAFTYPDEFLEYDGSLEIAQGLIATAQPRKSFGLSYRTMIGNDLDELDHGYQIHLVYNAITTPSDSEYTSDNETPELALFNWPITTLPVTLEDVKPFAHMIIDSTIADPEDISNLEDLLYGSSGIDPQLPPPEDLVLVVNNHAILLIIDNGDGTWTAHGPKSMIQMLDSTTFQITSPSAVFIDSESYTLSSL